MQARLNDLLTFVLRVERRFHPPFGMSLLAVARVGGEPAAQPSGGAQGVPPLLAG